MRQDLSMHSMAHRLSQIEEQTSSMPEDFDMRSFAHKPGQYEDEDIFQILEEWERNEPRLAPPATPFSSAPTQLSYLPAADASQPAAASASPYGPLLEIPDAEYGARPQSAPQCWPLEMRSEHLHRRATYPAAGPGPFSQSGLIRGRSLAPPSIIWPCKQQSSDASQQQLVPQWLSNQGDTPPKCATRQCLPQWLLTMISRKDVLTAVLHMLPGSFLSASASIDAEESSATAAGPSASHRRPRRRRKSEAWRARNRLAQKNFRRREKVDHALHGKQAK